MCLSFYPASSAGQVVVQKISEHPTFKTEKLPKLRSRLEVTIIWLLLPEYFKIGKLVSTFGLKGEMVLKHSLGKKTSLTGLKAIFTEDRKDSFFPWFVQSAKVKNETEIYLTIEGISSKEDAAKIIQREVWLPEADFKKFAHVSAPASLLGYEVIYNNRSLGSVLEVIEQPHQLLCRLEISSKEVFIPLNESTLQKTDHKNRQLFVTLPDGLLEVYL
jgi:16S rRNA processing protein RimM